MKVVDVYAQYFEADCIYNDQPRKAALVCMTSTYDNGSIQYEVSVNFFPYRDPQDFSVTYDARVCKEIYRASGRRSKKREAKFLVELRLHADSVAEELNGRIFWEKPLREARYG